MDGGTRCNNTACTVHTHGKFVSFHEIGGVITYNHVLLLLHDFTTIWNFAYLSIYSSSTRRSTTSTVEPVPRTGRTSTSTPCLCAFAGTYAVLVHEPVQDPSSFIRNSCSLKMDSTTDHNGTNPGRSHSRNSPEPVVSSSSWDGSDLERTMRPSLQLPGSRITSRFRPTLCQN